MGERLRLRGSGLEWRTVEEEVVALDMPRELYLGVNRSGSKLWQALARGTTRGELAQLLVEEYRISPARAEQDVARFISELQDRQLLDVEQR